MNVYTRSRPYTQIPELPAQEQRKFPRKMLRQQVSIGVAGQELIQGYTIDISAQGLSALIPISLKAGEICAVRFTLLFGDAIIRVTGVGRVSSCVCTGPGFRLGMHFKAQDPAVERALTAFTES